MMAKKHDLPAMPFYWGDWFKATDVQSLPKDIRCTWFELLGRMWESEKRGFFCSNGEPFSAEENALILGFGNDINLCNFHLNFLEKKGIFSRTKEGIIYSRRMVRDCKLSKTRKLAGKKGMKIRYNKNLTNTITTTITNTEYENEKNISVLNLNLNAKKGKEKYPTFDEFLEYAKTLKSWQPGFEVQLEAKFNQWNEEDWKDGFGKPIKNWKTKLQNTIIYFKINKQQKMFEKEAEDGFSIIS